MGYRMTVGNRNGISLEEAVNIANGFLLPENVAAERQCYIEETEE